MDGSTRAVSISAVPERKVQQGEEHESDGGGRHDVPGPRAEHAEQRPLSRDATQVHVVAARHGVDGADDGRIPEGDDPGAHDRPTSRNEALPDHEKQRRAHDRRMRHDVLDELEAGPADLQIRRQQRLKAAGEAPEVGDLDEEPVPVSRAAAATRAATSHRAKGSEVAALKGWPPRVVSSQRPLVTSSAAASTALAGRNPAGRAVRCSPWRRPATQSEVAVTIVTTSVAM